VLAAELVAYYFPALVELHNYYATNSLTKKKYNWGFLNKKVLKKLDTSISPAEIEEIVGGKGQAIEKFLLVLKYGIDSVLNGQKKIEASPAKPKSSHKKAPATTTK
jgi:hypothetical protein